MGIQTATTGNLASAQRIVVAETRYTAESGAPCINLIEKFSLGKGEKSITIPKVGQFEASGLTDGVDLTDTQSIGMNTLSLTTSEVGLKVILTDKLVRQENEDVFKIVGRQAGDALARKKDKDILALFTSLNGGSDLGSNSKNMELPNAMILAATAAANDWPSPIAAVFHTWSLFDISYGGVVGGQTAPVQEIIPDGYNADLLRDFFKINLDGVPFFRDNNIPIVSNGAQGAIFSKSAMCYAESVGLNQETERDASLRATEVVMTSDYGVFELDDTYGAGAIFVATAKTTG